MYLVGIERCIKYDKIVTKRRSGGSTVQQFVSRYNTYISDRKRKKGIRRD
jgi:hypothetical protein